MFNRKRKIALAAVLAATMLTGTAAQANNFADDWVSGAQVSSTSAGYYKGTQRGYFTAGSFSARWPQSSDHLLTISKPSIKSGCGGIDSFLGGFSFLNTDYLVQKLQRILAAAPAAAFDIALKTLAPQVSDTIKSLEAIIDKLNNLQLDDCKAAKALVAMAPNPFSGASAAAFDAEATSAKADFMTSSGADADWKGAMTKLTSSAKGMFTGATANAPDIQAASNAAIAGCPATLKTIFAGGSILEKIGAMKGIPASHIDSMRGYIGDVFVVTPATGGSDYDAVYLPPCGLNSYAAMIDGTAQIADNNGVCSDSTDTNRNLTQYVAQKLTTIASNIRSRSPISTTDAQFLASLPLPIMPALRAAVQTNSETMIIGKLADTAAKGMAYQMMMDMALRIYQIQDYANHIRATQKSADGASPESCQIALFEKPMQYMDQVVSKTAARTKEAYDGYVAAATDSSAIESLVATLDKFNTITRKEVTAQFNRGVAGRATGTY